MTEQERRDAILRRLVAMPVEAIRYPDPVLATGLTTLDAAIGGGLARGRITELFGPSSCGKTTLALQTVALAQARGLMASWIDADRTFSPERAAQLGVELEKLVFAQPDTAELAMALARSLALSGVMDLVVIDSAAALTPELELELGLGEAGPGLQARVLTTGLRRLTLALRRSGAVALVLNQTRGRPRKPVTEEFSAGGAPLKLYATTRIALKPDKDRVRFRLIRNRVASLQAVGVLRWKEADGALEAVE